MHYVVSEKRRRVGNTFRISSREFFLKKSSFNIISSSEKSQHTTHTH